MKYISKLCLGKSRGIHLIMKLCPDPVERTHGVKDFQHYCRENLLGTLAWGSFALVELLF